jgi:hypothetical protein
MDYQLSDEELKQLRLIERGLLTNEKLPHDRVLVASLIAKGLVRTSGIAVKITPEGDEALRSAQQAGR